MILARFAAARSDMRHIDEHTIADRQVDQGACSRSSVSERLNVFWLLCLIVIVVSGDITASLRDAALWRSWHGVALALLSCAMIAWYTPITIQTFRPRRVSRRLQHPFDDPGMKVWLAMGFVIVAALLALDPDFVGLTYALMGASLFLPARLAVLPVTTAIALNVWALGILPPAAGQSWTATAGRLFDTAMGDGLVYALVALMRERMQRERLFNQLSDAHTRLQAAAVHQAEAATLRERNRVAREMHDSLGHALVSISINLEAVRRLYPTDAHRAEAHLAETTALVRDTMRELRHSLAGLRPAALDGASLACACARLAEHLRLSTGISVCCAVEDSCTDLDLDLQETLYRVGQEALTNVAKHAHATAVSIAIGVCNGEVILEVQDNGVGLGAVPHDELGQFGVRGMRERMQAHGGTLTIGPLLGGGTVVRACVRLDGAHG